MGLVSVGNTLRGRTVNFSRWFMIYFPMFTSDVCCERSVVSGSSDKTVKFWDFELVTGKDGNRILSLIHK